MWDIVGIAVLGLLVIYALRRAGYLGGTGGTSLEQALTNSAQFLEDNGKKDNVITTDSGLQYEILEKGEEGRSPTISDKVRVHYHGTLLDGTVFDSSVERGEPISFGLNQVIPGWTEGMQKASIGGKIRLWIPANLGYGKRRIGNIPPGSLLIFDVELIDIEG